MAKEIEDKYLVVSDDFKAMATAVKSIRQGYISRAPERTVRIRIVDNRGFITLKGLSAGAARDEYEYEIPAADAAEILSRLCEGKVVSKTRYIVPFAGHTWEVDVFHGDDEGLVVAEIELPDEHTSYDLPPFAGRKVTGDPRYYNSNL